MNNEDMLRYDAQKKSQGVALVLWWLLGVFGGHRFYLKHTGTAVAQLLLALSVVGWPVLLVWLIVDVFMIFGMVNRYNDDLINRMKLDGFRLMAARS